MSSLSRKCPHFHGLKLKWLKIGSQEDSCTRALTHTHTHTHTHTNKADHLWSVRAVMRKWHSAESCNTHSVRGLLARADPLSVSSHSGWERVIEQYFSSLSSLHSSPFFHLCWPVNITHLTAFTPHVLSWLNNGAERWEMRLQRRGVIHLLSRVCSAY